MDTRLKRHYREEGDDDDKDDDELEMIPSEEPTFTVEEAIDSCGFGWFQIKSSFFCGLISIVDAMEIMVLSMLSPAARCEFNLDDWEQSLITTVVFAGMLLGAVFWGKLGDKIGRRKALFIVCVCLCIFGLISAFSFAYWFLLASRFLVGFAVAGGAQSATFLLEILPTKYRAYCMTMGGIFFSVGAAFEVLLAIFVMNPSSGEDHWTNLTLNATLITPTMNATAGGGGNWRYLLGFTVIPPCLSLIAFMFVPESARYYIASGQLTKAQEVLGQIARANNKPLPSGRLVSNGERAMVLMMRAEKYSSKPIAGDADEIVATGQAEGEDADDQDEFIMHSSAIENASADKLLLPGGAKQMSQPKKKSRGEISDLFSSKERLLTTVLLWPIWFAVAFGYYGIVLLTTEVLSIIDELKAGGHTDGTFMPCYDHTFQRNHTCALLVLDDYMQVLWTTAAELPGIILTVVLIERLGRRKTMALEFGICGVVFFLMFICPINKVALMALIFIGRASMTGAFQTVFVYTPEVYPTSIRAIGLGMCSTVSRVGAMISPFVAQVLLRKSIRGGEGIYAAACLVAVVCSLLLPIETRGRKMQDTLT
eukprot:m.264147 g.264147  ORF g.264147 m.264147 type:complete len:595 (+) comp40466_c0_seq4:76-1860(+)